MCHYIFIHIRRDVTKAFETINLHFFRKENSFHERLITRDAYDASVQF